MGETDPVSDVDEEVSKLWELKSTFRQSPFDDTEIRQHMPAVSTVLLNVICYGKHH